MPQGYRFVVPQLHGHVDIERGDVHDFPFRYVPCPVFGEGVVYVPV
jgi:hypothetical protein